MTKKAFQKISMLRQKQEIIHLFFRDFLSHSSSLIPHFYDVIEGLSSSSFLPPKKLGGGGELKKLIKEQKNTFILMLLNETF